MSQIEHTLTLEQILLVEKYIEVYDTKTATYGFREYIEINPLTLTLELPSPWRTDIENAPRDGTYIIAIDDEQCASRVAWGGEHCPECNWEGEFNSLKDSEIAYWMEIPELPNL